ncbi:hypothetical protein DPEC_G00038450 [Dallia pectoralis]|uniref:Uncharacterized protein n=1 Tax=Dallia pectoralis TaxID=75939 RepID=A0ACC2HE23_DALPE|nr:hypothetical protein DPEC_G00038450 [Dallia pectoralis]
MFVDMWNISRRPSCECIPSCFVCVGTVTVTVTLVGTEGLIVRRRWEAQCAIVTYGRMGEQRQLAHFHDGETSRQPPLSPGNTMPTEVRLCSAEGRRRQWTSLCHRAHSHSTLSIVWAHRPTLRAGGPAHIGGYRFTGCLVPGRCSQIVW